jgi:Protein of unknown function (DUF3168)
MSVGSILYSRLTTYAGTSALLSDRVYPVNLPQAVTRPAVTYREVSSVFVEGKNRLYQKRLQISFWAASYDGAVALAAQGKAALRGYADKASTPVLLGCEDVNTADTFEDESGMWGVIVDYFLIVSED